MNIYIKIHITLPTSFCLSRIYNLAEKVVVKATQNHSERGIFLSIHCIHVSHFLEIFAEIGIGQMASDNQKYLQSK